MVTLGQQRCNKALVAWQAGRVAPPPCSVRMSQAAPGGSHLEPTLAVPPTTTTTQSPPRTHTHTHTHTQVLAYLCEARPDFFEPRFAEVVAALQEALPSSVSAAKRNRLRCLKAAVLAMARPDGPRLEGAEGASREEATKQVGQGAGRFQGRRRGNYAGWGKLQWLSRDSCAGWAGRLRGQGHRVALCVERFPTQHCFTAWLPSPIPPRPNRWWRRWCRRSSCV